MADVVKGKLVWTADKKGRRVIYPTKKGTSIPTVFDSHQLAPPLKAKTDDEVEVELEVEGGKPVRIRPVGEPWQAAPPPPPPRTAAPPRPQGPRPGPPPPHQPQRSRPSDFVNPYNFLPAIDREKVTGPLGDSAPVGHDRFHENHFTGVVRVTLTTETPLLIPDAANGTENADGHKTFDVRFGADGKPYLAPTAVKGMLRSAYEAITNSRLGVFPGALPESDRPASGHGARLAYRRQAKVDVEPARIEEAGPDRVVVRVLGSRWLNSPAKLPRYQQRSRHHDKGAAPAALRYPDNSIPDHRDHVWVRVEGNGRVSSIRRVEDGDPGPGWLEGWVLITGANINNKKAERVFVVHDDDEYLPHDGPEARRLHALWTELINDYQETHVRDLEQRAQRNEHPWDYLGDQPGRTAWSRHVFLPDARNLTPGALVYLRRDDFGRVTDLFPVAISRKLFDRSPVESLPESLRPATELDKLSPADRVFGWVRQKGKRAHRGQLRVGPVRCVTEGEVVHKFPAPGLPLAILGQPKPQQVRFYLGDANGHAQPLGQPKEQAGYDAIKKLSGRKVFPRHASLPTDHWDWQPTADTEKTSSPGVVREYLRLPPTEVGKKRQDNQNRSVLGWVKPGTTFTFDLHVTNLSKVELGALVWLLTLPEGHVHRLGLAKPFGFGSVRLAIDPANTTLRDSGGWKQVYRTLDDLPAAADPTAEAQVTFEQELVRAYPAEAGRLVAAFKKAAAGIPGLPVHYPRVGTPGTPAPPNPNGEGYEWFVANDDRSSQLPLPELTSADPGLPVLERRRGRQS